MVTRKPVGAGPPISTSNASTAAGTMGNPPYPTSPVLESANSTASSNSVYSADLHTSPAFDLVDIHAAKQRARSDSDASSHGTWDSDDTMEQDHDMSDEIDMPKPLNLSSSQQDMSGKGKAKEGDEHNVLLPASLRIGGEQGMQPGNSTAGQQYEEEAQANPWAGNNSNRSSANGQLDSNNPYHHQNGFVMDNSQSAWQEVKPPAVPSAAPPPPPAAAPPLPPNATPAGPVELSAVKSPTESPPEWLQEERPASWETAEVLPVPQKGMAPFAPIVTPPPQQPVSQRPSSTWWQDPPTSTSEADQKQSGISTSAPPYPISEHPSEPEYEPPPGPPPFHQGALIDHEDPPARPPKPSPISTSQTFAAAASSAVPETPGTQLKRQRNEHYQIKHINWYDMSDPRGKSTLRQSPILTQNGNGPCPLLALVNALVLSTPQNLNTGLVEVLRTREQVSLGLLLDAVFDELMSGRRGSAAQELPDVSELYAFLLALHTGMNVNPRFVTPVSTPRGSLDGRPTSLTNVHPMHRAQRKAGVFEETREMRLYSTFGIPLVHGWVAPADSAAYEAFLRSAQTFEDAQNIQFLEGELEDKLQSEGLPPQEHQTLQDIQTIKSFLDTWPTQLTDFGLQAISDSLAPGQFAILFRNDHFSTIYKEPTHGALMTLVTDAGYSTHDEIVWESLVDVTGAASEMFSGDFRGVSHDQDVRLNQSNTGGGEDGWQTVQNRNQRKSSDGLPSPKAATDIPPPLPGPRPGKAADTLRPPVDSPVEIPDPEAQRKASEQEDHDLALALQLQEEEEANQREAHERRRREQELSEQFLSNESEGPRPPIPPRRSAGRGTSGPTTGAPTARPAVSRPSDDPGDPEAPPSYEQAASDRPYRPAGSTAPADMAQGNPLSAYDALRRQHSGNPPTPASPPYTPQNRRRSDARLLRRQSQMGGPAMPGAYQTSPNGQRVNQAANVKDADDRCVIM